jgi:type I restriction enzyme R subunit
LPLGGFEFKSPIREEANIYDAYKQLTERYKRDIPRKVYKKEDGALYFSSYEKEEKVSAYFKTDLIKIEIQ